MFLEHCKIEYFRCSEFKISEDDLKYIISENEEYYYSNVYTFMQYLIKNNKITKNNNPLSTTDEYVVDINQNIEKWDKHICGLYKIIYNFLNSNTIILNKNILIHEFDENMNKILQNFEISDINNIFNLLLLLRIFILIKFCKKKKELTDEYYELIDFELSNIVAKFELLFLYIYKFFNKHIFINKTNTKLLYFFDKKDLENIITNESINKDCCNLSSCGGYCNSFDHVNFFNTSILFSCSLIYNNVENSIINKSPYLIFMNYKI
uniref:Uncharacterized protein n=1 Tax=viral metagenome TaxID=1070528 RepID=A0A6C0J869_9ZZZZ